MAPIGLVLSTIRRRFDFSTTKRHKRAHFIKSTPNQSHCISYGMPDHMKICYCTLGFPGPLRTYQGKRSFLEEVDWLEVLLSIPELFATGGWEIVEVLVPRISISRRDYTTSTKKIYGGVGDANDDGDERFSTQTKQMAMRKKAATIASLAAEDYSRKLEQGDFTSMNTSGNLSKGNARRSMAEGASTLGPDDSFSNVERHLRRPQTSLAGGLPPLGRLVPMIQSSTGSIRNSGLGNASDCMNDANSPNIFDIGGDRKGSSTIPFAGTSRENGSFPALRKEDHGWRYNDGEHSEDVLRASNALENIQLDRKARSLTHSWRNIEDGVIEEDS